MAHKKKELLFKSCLIIQYVSIVCNPALAAGEVVNRNENSISSDWNNRIFSYAEYMDAIQTSVGGYLKIKIV